MPNTIDVTPNAGSGTVNGLTLTWGSGAVAAIVTVTVTDGPPNAQADSTHDVCHKVGGNDRAWYMPRPGGVNVPLLHSITMSAAKGCANNPRFYGNDDPIEPMPDAFWTEINGTMVSNGIASVSIDTLPPLGLEYIGLAALK